MRHCMMIRGGKHTGYGSTGHDNTRHRDKRRGNMGHDNETGYDATV